MAYLHCHSCDWSQDDFYTKGYNFFTKMWDDFKWTCKPRVIKFDGGVRDFKKGLWTPILIWKKKRLFEYGKLRPHPNSNETHCMVTDYCVFSWNWMLVEFERNIRSLIHMKWYTWEKWHKVKDKAVCPKCGDRNFDID